MASRVNTGPINNGLCFRQNKDSVSSTEQHAGTLPMALSYRNARSSYRLYASPGPQFLTFPEFPERV